MADEVASLTALYATTMELFHRERTGEGQEVEVAMFESMASFTLVEHANGAMFDPALGPAIYPRRSRAWPRANSLAARGVAARQHIPVAAAPCLPLMRSART